MDRKKPTIVDIANRLGISPSSVSKALSNHPKMANATKKKVAQAAKELGYNVNSMASGLRKGRSGLIGVMVPWVDQKFFSTAIKGIEDVLTEAGYNIIIGQSKDNEEKEKVQVKAFLNAQVEGIIASISANTVEFSHFENAIELGVNIILFDRGVSGFDVEQVLIDDYEGAFKATEHLMEMGYKRIAVLAGPSTLSNFNERVRGTRDAIKRGGLTVDESIIKNVPLDASQGEVFVTSMLELKDPPDAFFCHSDIYALGALKAIESKGLNVPDDVGLIGFSNEDFTTYVSPSISTVDQFSEKMGNIAAKSLLNQLASEREITDIKKKFVAQKHILMPELLIRKSTSR